MRRFKTMWQTSLVSGVRFDSAFTNAHHVLSAMFGTSVPSNNFYWVNTSLALAGSFEEAIGPEVKEEAKEEDVDVDGLLLQDLVIEEYSFEAEDGNA